MKATLVPPVGPTDAPQSPIPRPRDGEAFRGILIGLLLAVPIWLALGILVALVL